MANHYGVKVKYMTKSKLSDFTGNRPHQNVVLKASKLDYIDIRHLDDVKQVQGKEEKTNSG